MANFKICNYGFRFSNLLLLLLCLKTRIFESDPSEFTATTPNFINVIDMKSKTDTAAAVLGFEDSGGKIEQLGLICRTVGSLESQLVNLRQKQAEEVATIFSEMKSVQEMLVEVRTMAMSWMSEERAQKRGRFVTNDTEATIDFTNEDNSECFRYPPTQRNTSLFTSS
jgi:hypothetical protein